MWFAEGSYMRRRLSSVSVMAFGHRLPSRMSQVGGEGAALASQRDCPQSLFDSYLKPNSQGIFVFGGIVQIGNLTYCDTKATKLDWLQSEREGAEQRGGTCQRREERCLGGEDNWT